MQTVYKPIWLASLACSILLPLGCRNGQPSEASLSAERAKIAVRFEFDFGENETTVIELDDLPASSTVADGMRRIQQIPDQVTIEMQGSGAMTFVSAINELKTAAGEGWSYRVNNQWAEAGVGATGLHDGDVVRWSHGAFEE